MKEAAHARENKRLLRELATVVCAVACLLCTILSQAQPTLQVLQGHVNPAVAKGLAKPAGLLAPSKHLHLAIQLPLRNQDELTSFLQRLYDRKSPDFRKYLSVEEFTEKYGPTKEDYQAVVDFVKANGMTVMDTPRNRMLVEVDGAVPQVEKAFHVVMKNYQHPTENRVFYSIDREPSLALHVPVSHISGLNNFYLPRSHPRPMKTTPLDTTYSPTGSGPNGFFLPGDVRMAYYGNGSLDGSGQCIGLVTFWGFNVSDVDLTYTSAGLTVPSTPINTVLLGGLTTPMTSVDDGEPITDIVASMSIAPNLSQVREYQCCSPDYDGAEAGQDIIYNSMASENICKQFSESAGVIAQPVVDDPYFEEMAAQGQSFLAASGDGGAPPVAGFDSYDWFYPGDNAWITGVGATTVTTNGAGGAWLSEVANNWSGGGVSNGPNPVPIPSYQVPVINSSNGGSTTLRNVPDVAALGGYAYLCDNGECGETGGTSYSSPLWAGFIALVNQQAVENGQPTVGFLNPIIYEIGQGANYNNDFHDMIGGNDDCCGQPVYYNAVAGYDLVTGWGTPNGQNLIDDLLATTATPSYTLMASPATLSIGRSDSGSINMLVGASGGFTGNVTLAASGLPSGVTASFGTNPTTGTSVLTLTSSSTATTGTSPVTITGTFGSLSASTTMTLTVTTTPGNFTVGYGLPNLAPTWTFPGTTVATQITVTGVDNFSSAVALSATNLPVGMAATFSPSSVTPASNSSCATSNPCAFSTMTLVLSSSAVVGVDMVTITGTSGSLVNSTIMPVDVNGVGSGPLANGIYTVTNASSGLLWDDPSSSTAWGADMILNSVDGGADEQWVFISLGSSPGNAYYQIENVASSLWLDVADVSTAAGGLLDQWGWNGGTPNQEWLLKASGNGYVITTDLDGMAVDPGTNIVGSDLVQEPTNGASTQVWLVSTVFPQPDFTIGVTPTSQGLTQGGSGTNTITITSLHGFNSAATFSISGLPDGVTATFSPSSVTPSVNGSATSTLTLTASSTFAMGATDTARGGPFASLAWSAGRGAHGPRWTPAIMLTLLIAPLSGRFIRTRRQRLARAIPLAIGVLLLMLGAISCGGGNKTPVPSVSSSTITVTATSGTLTHSTTFTLWSFVK